MGVAASSLALLDKNGMLEPYKPLNFDALMPQYVDKKNPPAWFGMDVWGATVCFNTVEAQKKGIPKPETWKDLLKPAYKGQVVMPNPASSGTGFFDVTAWLALWGDDNGKGGGWKYMDALHENIAQYTHSGSKPCNMAAAGEFVVGISFEYRANTNKAKGAPIDLVFPKEGLGWDLEAFAIHKGTKKLEAAKKLADWASSKDAMLLYGKNFAITAQPGLAPPLPNVPKDYEARLVKKDFYWEAEHRDRDDRESGKRLKSSPQNVEPLDVAALERLDHAVARDLLLLLDQRHRRRQVFRVPVERPQEHEHVVRARAADEVAVRDLARQAHRTQLADAAFRLAQALGPVLPHGLEQHVARDGPGREAHGPAPRDASRYAGGNPVRRAGPGRRRPRG